MRILSAQQHRALDQATMDQDGISSLELMERAATAWTKRFTEHYHDKSREIVVVCGPGNNGGDGLAIARLLRFEAYTLSILVADIAPASPDHQSNLRRAKDVGVHIRTLREGDPLPSFRKHSIVIDALFGTGLSRPITGYWSQLIDHLNAQEVVRVAVDLPSGLRADEPTEGAVIQAELTLSLGYPKLALFAPANTEYLGHWELVPFRLAPPPGLEASKDAAPRMLTPLPVAQLLKKRRANDHKGTFGHALLVAGSFGKMGAAVLSARSVLRAGAGLLSVHIPRVGYEIMQISLPEAMCIIDQHRYMVTSLEDVTRYDAIGVGPGLGTKPGTREALFQLLKDYDHPLVIDADALNLLAESPEKLQDIPPGSVLTPHPKEFERLFGTTANDFERWELQKRKAHELNSVIVLKTGYTVVTTPEGQQYFNTTGNPGMGTGGTGDALTGLLTGPLAQGYAPAEAARLGVYLHGLAGDLAAKELGQESLLAEDLIRHVGEAFRKLHRVAEKHQ